MVTNDAGPVVLSVTLRRSPGLSKDLVARWWKSAISPLLNSPGESVTKLVENSGALWSKEEPCDNIATPSSGIFSYFPLRNFIRPHVRKRGTFNGRGGGRARPASGTGLDSVPNSPPSRMRPASEDPTPDESLASLIARQKNRPSDEDNEFDDQEDASGPSQGKVSPFDEDSESEAQEAGSSQKKSNSDQKNIVAGNLLPRSRIRGIYGRYGPGYARNQITPAGSSNVTGCHVTHSGETIHILSWTPTGNDLKASLLLDPSIQELISGNYTISVADDQRQVQFVKTFELIVIAKPILKAVQAFALAEGETGKLDRSIFGAIIEGKSLDVVTQVSKNTTYLLVCEFRGNPIILENVFMYKRKFGCPPFRMNPTVPQTEELANSTSSDGLDCYDFEGLYGSADLLAPRIGTDSVILSAAVNIQQSVQYGCSYTGDEEAR